MRPASSVPKFGSFKPKLSTSPNISSHRANEHMSRDRSASPRKRRAEHRRSSPATGHDACFAIKSHKRGRKSFDPKDRAEQMNERSKNEDLDASEFFFLDRRGDPQNVQFGSLYKYSIPAYRRYGQGGVVGAPCGVKVDRTQSTDRELVLRSFGDGSTGLSGRRVFSAKKSGSIKTNEHDVELTFTPSDQASQNVPSYDNYVRFDSEEETRKNDEEDDFFMPPR